MAYTWEYQTTISAVAGSVRITEFGAFGEIDGQWVFGTITDEPFTPEDFEDWYSCPEAVVLAGEIYSDPTNWSGGDDLRDATAGLWYFIGVNDKGETVKGEAIVEELPILAS